MKKLSYLLNAIVVFILLSASAFGQKNNYDVKNYSIYLDTIDIQNRTLYAHTIITVEIPNGTESIGFDLLQMNIDKVEVNDTPITSFTSTETNITINYNQFVSGDNKIHIWYHGVPFSESWGGVIFNGEYVYNLGVGISTIPHNLGKAWFPCNDNFTDKATFEYFITVPENKIATCGGLFQSEIINSDRTKTFHYKTEKELSTYHASFATGEYVVVEDEHQGINGNIPITYTLRPTQVDAAEVLFQNIHQIISIFEDKFGPYAFERVGYTATSIGAMEHQNNISFPNSCITSNLNYESLYAHELFHSWFGNLITCATAEDMWINEGWATFGEYYFEEELYDKSLYTANILAAKNTVVTKAHLSNQDGDYLPLNQIPQTNTYGVSAYQRGGIVVHSLRNYLGDDLFFSSVKQMLADNAYTAMSSEDLCAALSVASGVDLNGFFHNYVYQGGISGYLIDSCIVINNGNNTWDTEIYMQQKLRKREELSNSNRVEVTFMDFALNTETVLIEFDGQYGQKSHKTSIEPAMVFVNYYDKIYDAKFSSEFIIKSLGTKNYSYTNFKTETVDIEDSAYIHVSHYLIAPNDPLNVIGPYRISDNHFWKIDLAKYGNSDITGMFFYSKTGYDSDLILDNNDSVYLMYRANYSDQWQKLNTTRLGGSVNLGELWFDNLTSGEYAFAVVDSTINSVTDYSECLDNHLLVYPNPSDSFFTIQFKEDINNKFLTVYDLNNKKIDKFYLDEHSSEIKWAPKNTTKNQVYIFVLQKKNGQKIVEKALMKK